MASKAGKHDLLVGLKDRDKAKLIYQLIKGLSADKLLVVKETITEKIRDINTDEVSEQMGVVQSLIEKMLPELERPTAVLGKGTIYEIIVDELEKVGFVALKK